MKIRESLLCVTNRCINVTRKLILPSVSKFKFCPYYLGFWKKNLLKRYAHWFGLLAPVWLNLNSLKAIPFKGRFPGCMRNVFYVRYLDIFEIIFWFRFNMICISLKIMVVSVRQQKFYLYPTLSQNEEIFFWYEKRFSYNE